MTQQMIVSLSGAAPVWEAPQPEIVLDFRAVYDTYFPFVWRAARRLGVRPSALDDVVQEVFLVVHRKLASLYERTALKSWIYGVVVRVVADHRRTLRRKSPHERGEPIDSADLAAKSAEQPDQRLMANEAKRTLDRILDSMDDDQRTVFVLHELEGLTVPEIAEITDTKLNTVYSRLRLARADFEDQLSRSRGTP